MDWDGRVRRGMADDDNHDWFFILWPPTQRVEKTHRVWRVSKCCQPRRVERREEQPRRDADALSHIIILPRVTGI